MEQAISGRVRQFQQRAMERGLSAEDAAALAQDYATEARTGYQERQRYQQQQVQAQAKRDTADSFIAKYGLTAQHIPSLMTARTAPDMEAIAQREKRYQDQESRLKALELGRVPPQVLDSGAGGAAAGGVTGQNIDRLWMAHERANDEARASGRPEQPNPYTTQYRTLLRR